MQIPVPRISALVVGDLRGRGGRHDFSSPFVLKMAAAMVMVK